MQYPTKTQASVSGFPQAYPVCRYDSSKSLRRGYYAYTTRLVTTRREIRSSRFEAGAKIMARTESLLPQGCLASRPRNRLRYFFSGCVAAQSTAGRFLQAKKSEGSRARTLPPSVPHQPRQAASMDVLCARISRLIYRAFLAHVSRAAFSVLVWRASICTHPLGTQSGAEGAEPID